MDTNFGTNVSNEMLLNTRKISGLGGGGKITPHTQIRVKKS